MDGQNFQNDQNNYQDYTTNVQPTQAVVEEPKQTNVLAIVSLVLGRLAIVCGCCLAWVGCLFGIAGIICAVLSKKNGKSGLATAGLICSIAGIVLGLAITIFSVVFSVALMDELSSSGYYY